MATQDDHGAVPDVWPAILAEEANEAGGSARPESLDVLAIAYAHVGRFDEAAATAECAIPLAETEGKSSLAAEIGNRRDLYRQRKPFRQSSTSPGSG